MNRAVIAGTIAIFIAFGAYVVTSSMAESSVSCEICVEFKGLQNCATAAAVSEAEAERSAQSTACATISGGVTDGIACGNARPTLRSCGPTR